MSRCLIVLVVWAGLCPLLGATNAHAQAVPFGSEEWSIEAKESRVEDYKGRRALFLKDGRALLKGVQLEDGVIEFDLAVGQERGFSGVMFRIEDDHNYEEFYVRHHLSGMPDANQYSPVFGGISGWQIYAGPRYSAPVRYTPDEWMHIRLIVSGTKAEVTMGDARNVVSIPELKRKPIAGGLGVYSNLAPARFANFSYRKGTEPVRGGDPSPEPRPANVVQTWEVSTAFDEKALDGADTLPESILASLRWSSLDVERNGIANLARLGGVGPGRNTVLARVRLVSERDRIRKVRFGFSDRVRVYLDGRPLFAGDDGYQSRDYRFLGTVGLFDTLLLSLPAGAHDLLFAVSESFGGWAVIAQIDDW